MDKKINLSQLADLMAEAGGMSKTASEQFVKSFFDIISQSVLDEGIVKVKGFGTFKLLQMEDRESVNVNTGERFTIEGHQKISFTPDAELKERINKPFSAFETVVITEEQVSELSDVEISKELPTTESDDAEAVAIVETESVDTESADTESVEPVVENKPEAKEPQPQVKDITQKRGTRIFLKIVVFILSVILVACIALYLLWPVVGKAIIKSYAEKVRPAVEAVRTDSRESKPVVEPKPVVEEAKPVIEEAKPVIEEAKPVVEEAKPVVEEAKPVVETARPAVQPFALNKEDQAKALSQFSEADTVNYRIIGRLAVHTIQDGESLTKIALKYYGTKKLWPYLVKYNNLDSYNNLKIGNVIRIPELAAK